MWHENVLFARYTLFGLKKTTNPISNIVCSSWENPLSKHLEPNHFELIPNYPHIVTSLKHGTVTH